LSDVFRLNVQYFNLVRHAWINPKTMNTKLTLRLDERLIARAKDYAAVHGSSVSQMVANYFAALTQKADANAKATKPDNAAGDVGPVTRRLTGILKAQPGQPQVNVDDYRAYLERKYLGSEGKNTPPAKR